MGKGGGAIKKNSLITISNAHIVKRSSNPLAQEVPRYEKEKFQVYL